MKRIFLVAMALLCSAAISAARDNAAPKKTQAKPAPKTAQKAPAPPAWAIPASAERLDENTYRHTDGQGKVWYYRKTPFGVMKTEQAPDLTPQLSNEIARDRQSPFAAQQAVAAHAGQMQDAEMLAVTETADTVTFTRGTPFGKSSWTRRKSDLTADERAMWDRAKQNKTK